MRDAGQESEGCVCMCVCACVYVCMRVCVLGSWKKPFGMTMVETPLGLWELLSSGTYNKPTGPSGAVCPHLVRIRLHRTL